MGLTPGGRQLPGTMVSILEQVYCYFDCIWVLTLSELVQKMRRIEVDNSNRLSWRH
jgi:hypothetical protein